MATTIRLTDEAYENLKAVKRDDESFSDVVMRLTTGRGDRMKGFGAWADTDLRDEARAYRDEVAADAEERRDAPSRRHTDGQ